MISKFPKIPFFSLSIKCKTQHHKILTMKYFSKGKERYTSITRNRGSEHTFILSPSKKKKQHKFISHDNPQVASGRRFITPLNLKIGPFYKASVCMLPDISNYGSLLSSSGCSLSQQTALCNVPLIQQRERERMRGREKEREKILPWKPTSLSRLCGYNEDNLY